MQDESTVRRDCRSETDLSHVWGHFKTHFVSDRVLIREINVKADCRTSLHSHQTCDEVYVILAGRLDVLLGKETGSLSRVSLSAGDTMFVRRNEWHALDGAGRTEDCRLVEVVIYDDRVDLEDIKKDSPARGPARPD